MPDLIIPWSEVQEGDQVLLEGELTAVERVNAFEDCGPLGTFWSRVDVSWRDGGHLFVSTEHESA